MILFDLLHYDRGQYCATSDVAVRFQKNYPGISRGLSVKKSGDLSFLRKCYYNFFYFLHEANTVQYLAAVSLSGSTSRLLN